MESEAKDVDAELYMKYFVLKPGGNDAHAKASREAMLRYAEVLCEHNISPRFADGIRAWAMREKERWEGLRA